MKLGAVLLAAGLSRRWQESQGAFEGRCENKLLAAFNGRPMVCYALDALAMLGTERTAVVTANGQIAALALDAGAQVVHNAEPQRGIGHSIALGAEAMRGMDALLLMAADQPLLTGESLCRLAKAYAESEKGLACLRDETHWGNPAIFGARYFETLRELDGDKGAKRILRAYEDDLLIVPCAHPHELEDADDPETLMRISRRLSETRRG